MAKPICVIKVDTFHQPKDLVNKIADILKERMPDYHVFVIPNENRLEPIDALEFQVFHEKDFTEVQYEELKKFIQDSLHNQTEK